MNINDAWQDLSNRFNLALNDIADNQTEKALTETLITIGAYSATMIPIDTSNLINSEFRDVKSKSGGWVGRLGYGANYALYVHEAKGTLTGQPRANGNGTYWSPNGEPKFLLKAGQETAQNDLETILRRNYER